MTIRSDGRRIISVTMLPELYERLREHCRLIDRPLTVFTRSAIEEKLVRDERLGE